jgi:GNAT superfamily N-acetyltransferase
MGSVLYTLCCGTVLHQGLSRRSFCLIWPSPPGFSCGSAAVQPVIYPGKALAQPFRKHGLGNRIVADLEAEIRKDPLITAIRLGCQVNNDNAMRFWQRCGYRIIGPPTLYPEQTIGCLLEKQVEQQILQWCGFITPAPL